MSLLCHLHLHAFQVVDLGRAFGVALECRRCRYQVRDKVPAVSSQLHRPGANRGPSLYPPAEPSKARDMDPGLRRGDG